MYEAIIARFAGSFLPSFGSGHVGSVGGADAGSERGDGCSLGAGMADTRIG